MRSSDNIYERGLRLGDLRRTQSSSSPRLRRNNSPPSSDASSWRSVAAGPHLQPEKLRLTNWQKLRYIAAMTPKLPTMSTLADEAGGSPRTMRAAARWDAKQKRRQGHAEQLFQIIERSPSHRALRTASEFERALRDIRHERIWVREQDPPKEVYRKAVVKQVVEHVVEFGEEWSLPRSIWAPRSAQADSGDYHDTPEVMRAWLDLDWSLALADHNTRTYIEELDKSGEDAVAACYEVLAANIPFVLGVFDYYATLAGSATDDSVYEIVP